MQIADRPPRPVFPAIPPAFLVAFAIMVFGSAFVGFAWAHALSDIRAYADRDNHDWFLDFARYGRPLIAPALSLAVAALMMLGFAELARRAGPARGDGLALRLGLAGSVVIFLCLLVSLYVNHWYVPRRPAGSAALMEDFWLWHQRVACTSALLSTAALLYAGRRLFLVQALAVPLVIATIFAYPVESVWELFHTRRPTGDDLWMGAFVDLVIDVGFATVMLFTLAALGRALPPTPVDVARSGEGLQRIGSALVARVLVLVVGAFLTIATIPSQSVGLARLMLSVIPACLLFASIALVTGMFQAAGLAAQLAPRLRLYAAGACTMVAFVADGIRAVSAYNLVATGGDSWARERTLGTLEVLPYAIPGLALAGMLLLLSAVNELRRWAPGARTDQQMVVNAGVAVTLFSVAAVVLLREASPPRADIGFYIMISILVAIANVAAQIAVARVCHRVAEEMREAPALPTAVIAPPRP